MSDRRVVFDFSVTFANGGGLQGQDFRLDIPGETIGDDALAAYIVDDLRLLMVSGVDILNKRYVVEAHKRPPDRTPSGTGLVDLGHPVRHGMVTYPGLPAPVIDAHLARADSHPAYGDEASFQIGRIDLVANTGTYIDAPFHRFADGADIASLDLARLTGAPGVVVRTEAQAIGPEVFTDIDTWGKAVLIHTGWDRHFGTAQYVGAHPHLTAAAAERLAGGGALLVGIDSSNLDDTADLSRPAHTILLSQEIPVVEHLTRLDQLPASGFEFFAIPAPVVGMTSFPVRPVARWG